MITSAVSVAAPLYEITEIGFVGFEHTRDDGHRVSFATELNEAGQVRGGSSRYNGGSADLGNSAWLYNGTTTLDIGLVGTEHTRNDGYKSSITTSLNEAGQVSGHSTRYNGGSASMGQSVWFYDGASTLDIGLVDSEHTRSDGYKNSSNFYLTEAGQVSGSSTRFNGGGSPLGESAWFYNGTTTVNIGLIGPEHTRNDGYKGSFAFGANEAGQVGGLAVRYNGGSTYLGESVWLFNGTSTLNVGPGGSEYTRSDGYQGSSFSGMNAVGQVSGSSTRYNGGSVSLGSSSWLYNGTTTVVIGLVGAEHTRNDGYRASSTSGLNAAGQVRGFSYRYNGSTQLGQSAWLYNGTSTLDIGLVGAEHTRNDGTKFSETYGMNAAGQVSGYSYRYNGGSTQLGQSAWLYDGTTTVDIGLVGSEHTRNDGYKASGASAPNAAGQVRGVSVRYNGGSADLGRTAWLFDGVTTFDIGLVGSEYTRDDGYKYSQPTGLNAAGQVIGYSYRYNGGNLQQGQDAWVYDPILDQTVTLQLSARSDGYAFSTTSWFRDEGVVLGYYELYSGMTSLGYRAFSWSRDDGLHDLGALVDTGLTNSGWEALYNAVEITGSERIIGIGAVTGLASGQSAYLLTPLAPTLTTNPAVPEPNSLALLLLGGLLLYQQRRGKAFRT